MNITCPSCKSECLDQGIDGKILCHDCNKFYILVGTWNNLTLLTDT